MDTPFLYYLSEFFVFAGIIIAVVFMWLLHRNPPAMKIMNAVWVLTGLWAHFLALAAYFKLSKRFRHTHPAAKSEKKNGSFPDCCSENAQDRMYEYMRIGRMMEEEMTDDLPEDFSENEKRNRGWQQEKMQAGDNRREFLFDREGVDGEVMDGGMMHRKEYGYGSFRPQGETSGGVSGMNSSSGVYGVSGMSGTNGPMEGNKGNARWRSVTLSTLHCGAGCTLGDIIGEWFTYRIPVYIGGSALAGRWVLDFILALLLGVYFQFASIRQMERVPAGQAVKRALKADFLSLTSWQIGMYGWMALVHFVLFKNGMPGADSWVFWFMMQIAMLFGFFFSYPINSLLLRWGIKREM